jgi:DNA-binding CsgD family transcriptional regulator
MIPLTARQQQCLDGLARGLTYAMIAAELGISPHTVKVILRQAYERLGARTAAHAVALMCAASAPVRGKNAFATRAFRDTR